jgi:hypothetical protein
MKLLIMQFSPTSYHFIPLRSKYSPQHPVPPLMSETNYVCEVYHYSDIFKWGGYQGTCRITNRKDQSISLRLSVRSAREILPVVSVSRHRL